MSRLDELIAELCPNGVEYRKLGDFASVSRGGSFQKKDFAEVGTPCIHYGQIYTRYGLFADTTFSFITDEAASKSRFASQNDIVMAVTSENVVDVCKCVAWLGSDDIAISGHTAIIKHDQNPKYLTYYFHSSMFFTQKVKIANGTKVIEVSPNKLKDILIPIPPLAIQEEIVRILDNFTELSAGLSAELSNELAFRNKQYEYYRNELLSFDDRVEWLTLEDVFDIRNGYTPSKKIPEYWNNGTIPWFRMEDIRLNGRVLNDSIQHISPLGVKKSGLFKKNSIMIATTATLGNHALITCDYLSNQQLTNLTIKDTFISKIIPMYAFYYFFIIDELCESVANFSGGIPIVDQKKFKKLRFPVPNIRIQERIVAILDSFDTLCNDISVDLSAEIETRQKQYKYYMNKLLTFKELSE